jgi:hypothetical protein
MPRPTFAAASLAVALTFFSAAAHADSLTAEFKSIENPELSSGGSITLALQADGSISASLSANFGRSIWLFGLDFPTPSAVGELNNLPTDYFVTGLGTQCCGNFYQAIGITEPTSFVSQMSFTIGKAGQFTSVLDALGGPSPYDFYLLTADDGNFGNGRNWVANAVPEPSTALLTLLGLAALGVAVRGRKKATAS